MCAAVRDLPENNAERLNQSRRGSEMIRELTGKELDERRSVVLLQNQNIEELLRQVWSNTVEVDYRPSEVMLRVRSSLSRRGWRPAAASTLDLVGAVAPLVSRWSPDG